MLLRLLLLGAIAAGLVRLFYGEEIEGFSGAGTNFAAKTACSCRYVAGREIGSCSADLGEGFGAIWLSADEGERSVTARVPLVASATATYSAGSGCVLERWSR